MNPDVEPSSGTRVGQHSRRKNIAPMTAWWVGLVLIAVVVGYLAYRFSCLECSVVSGPLEFLLLAIIPTVYLGLMYLTFKSQSDSEKS